MSSSGPSAADDATGDASPANNNPSASHIHMPPLHEGIQMQPLRGDGVGGGPSGAGRSGVGGGDRIVDVVPFA
eukprot:CAMPEP_0113556452 /NCGR_PEP_ID=MMETSP0015_2-20120614/17263_1 /TAXON_ID=2838 /ORGANISM="Odontella" /LENGTH=72 /DNA_ID=CAMNT_0000457807 /DNA_START=640 /DNA_END=854 /DNA_ORIENTATION=+ /assembly_acc=CAM_ASM_000160